MDIFLKGTLGLLLACMVLMQLLFVIVMINNGLLSRYLKTFNYHRWRYLCSLGDGKLIGIGNIFKLRAYLRSKDDEDDLALLRIKDRLRRCFLMIKVLVGNLVSISLIVVIYCIFFYE